jgi:hypothetical protein
MLAVCAAGVSRNLLQADDIRILVLDDLDHAFEPATPVAPTDSLVDVVSQESDHKSFFEHP